MYNPHYQQWHTSAAYFFQWNCATEIELANLRVNCGQTGIAQYYLNIFTAAPITFVLVLCTPFTVHSNIGNANAIPLSPLWCFSIFWSLVVVVLPKALLFLLSSNVL